MCNRIVGGLRASHLNAHTDNTSSQTKASAESSRRLRLALRLLRPRSSLVDLHAAAVRCRSLRRDGPTLTSSLQPSADPVSSDRQVLQQERRALARSACPFFLVVPQPPGRFLRCAVMNTDANPRPPTSRPRQQQGRDLGYPSSSALPTTSPSSAPTGELCSTSGEPSDPAEEPLVGSPSKASSLGLEASIAAQGGANSMGARLTLTAAAGHTTAHRQQRA